MRRFGFTALALAAAITTASAAEKPWTVGDNILVERLPGFVEFEFGAAPFLYTPDRKRVAFFTLKADPSTDEVESRLRVYDVAALEEFATGRDKPEPSPLLTFDKRSLSARAGVSDMKWAPDGRALFFIVQEDLQTNALYRWSGSGAPVRLFSADTPITAYMFLGSDRRIAVFSHAKRIRDGRFYAPELVNGRYLGEAISDGWRINKLVTVHRLHVFDVERGSATAITGDFSLRDVKSASPDGRWVLLAEPFESRWSGTCWEPVHSSQPPANWAGVGRTQVRYVLVDTQSGTLSRPFDAPTGAATGAFPPTDAAWSKDSRRVLVPFALTEREKCGARGGAGMVGVFDLDVASMKAAPVHRFVPSQGFIGKRLIGVSWGADERSASLLFQDGRGPLMRLEAKKDAKGKWTVGKEEPMSGPPPGMPPRGPQTLSVRQDYNEPPAIVVVAAGGGTRVLKDLAPHARGRSFTKAEPVEWKDAAGNKWDGLLLYPRDYREGRRAPLLLQTHGFTPGQFVAEGPTTTAFPGRAATERGFFVLTMNENFEVIVSDTAREGPAIVAGYRGAIDALAGRGLIDPKRVGVIGWSRTSYHVKYALTHAPELFAAAVATDGVNYGFGDYLSGIDLLGDEDAPTWVEKYGGGPWANLDRWKAEAPIFGADRVVAPFRGEANSQRAALISEWDFYAALRRLNKPAELWVYPHGEHSLVRPLERRVSQEGSLDWLDYWINDYRDPDPAKREQYKRWDAMPRPAQTR